MTRLLHTAAPALLVVLGAGAGAARGDTSTEPYAGVAVEQLYDSNVLNSRGADAVTRVTPRLGLLLEGPRLTLDLDYRLGIHNYAEGTAPSSINHRASAVGRAALTPRLDADTRLLFVAGEDPILLDVPGLAVPQGAFTELEAHLGASYQAARRLTLQAAYLYRRSRFDLADGPNPLAFDGDEHRVDAGAGWMLTRRLQARAVARYQHFVGFDVANSLGDAAGGGAGLQYSFSSQTTARVEAGPLWFGGEATWFALAQVTHQGERARWTLAAYRDLYGGTGEAEALWAETVQGQAVIRLTRQLDLRLRAGAYRNGAAPSGDVGVSGLLGRADVGWSIFGDNARVELYGEHRAQDAGGGLAFGDVQRTVVGLRLVAVAGVDLLSLGDNP